MLKFVGLILILVSSTISGFISFSKFKLKINFLEQFFYLVRFIEMKIQYTEDLIFSIFASFKTENKILENLLTDFTANLKNSDSSENGYCNCISIINKTKLLKNDEIDIINNFIGNLGSSDLDSQIKLCEVTKNTLREKIKLASEEKEKKSKICLLMHLAAGLVFVIILL